MSSDPSFQALQKVFQWTGLDKVTFANNTSTHPEEQFWAQFDQIYDVKESDLMEHLPLFVADSRSRAKIEAGSYRFEAISSKQIA